MSEIRQSEFKRGDRVWSYSLQEWGEVTRDDGDDYEYPLLVEFRRVGKINYTKDGRSDMLDKAPDLFHDFHVEVIITPPPRPLPDIPVDTKMLVWHDGQRVKKNRHFAGWGDGRCFCYKDGMTSFTAYDEVTEWDNWEIVEQ